MAHMAEKNKDSSDMEESEWGSINDDSEIFHIHGLI